MKMKTVKLNTAKLNTLKLQTTKPQTSKLPSPNKNDKRPIAKFHRSWLQDTLSGTPLEKHRGINQAQYAAADRLSSNYQRIFSNGGWSPEEVQVKQDYFRSNGVERKVQAIINHNRIFKQLSKNSQAIIEHFCLNEQPIRAYELKQIPNWPKGAGTARLREGLDELVEIYKNS